MSTAIDSALAFITSSYQDTSPAKQAEIVQVVIKAGKVQRVKATALPNVQGETKVAPESKDHAKGQEAAKDLPAKPIVKGPARGTYDARGFLAAWRKARTRDEQIAALAGYQGFDPKLPLGEQEFHARSLAMREIRGPIDTSGPSRAEIRSASRSIQGFVAGMPDGTARQIGDLMAREKLAAEALAGFLKDAADPSKTEAERKLAQGMAAVEEARIGEIRKDLARLT